MNDVPPLPPSTPVGVVGAGTMGAGIAYVAAVAGHDVWLYDQDQATTSRALTTIGDHLDRAVTKGRLRAGDAEGARKRLHVADALDQLASCELVLEAVAEDLAVKQSLFSALEAICGPTAILASNTSSLSVTDIAAGLRRPARVAGLHFFNPAPVLPLVEVVAGQLTDPTVVDALAATAAAWGKRPVRAASTPGFIVNRVARPFYGEAFRLLSGGDLDAATVDAMLRESGGFRMGPFELADLIGHDVNLAVSESVWEAFGHDARFTPSELQRQLVGQGRLGRKTGRGIYTVGEPRPEPSTAPPATGDIGSWTSLGRAGLVARLTGADGVSGQAVAGAADWAITTDDIELRVTDGRTAAELTADGPRTVVLLDLALDYGDATRVGIAVPPSAPPEHVDAVVAVLQGAGYAVTLLPDTPGLVVARTVATLAAAAADAVDTGVATADDVDTAMKLGVNYPRGPYEWGDALGWSWVAGVLDALAAEDEARYRVSAELRARAGGRSPRAAADPSAVILARRAADAMWAGDAASQALGMVIQDVAPGHAEVSMRVRPDMVNGHHICHGGLVFALADTAFAFACNSYNRNTVAYSCDITFLMPAHEGDLLVAKAIERRREGRTGIYDVTVYRREPQPLTVLAEFRGRSREIAGTLVEEESEA